MNDTVRRSIFRSWVSVDAKKDLETGGIGHGEEFIEETRLRKAFDTRDGLKPAIEFLEIQLWLRCPQSRVSAISIAEAYKTRW